MKLLKKAWNLIKKEDGWGIVEALIIVAAFSMLAVGVTTSLGDNLTGTGGATGKVNTTINDLIDQATN